MNKHFSELGRHIKEPPISWLMKLTIDNPRLISLAAGFTDSETLPIEETRQIVEKILSRKSSGRIALQYGSTEGDPQLRKLTSERLKKLDKSDNPAYSPDRLLITNGSQQLLYMLVEALCSDGDIVLIEAPTYFVFLAILQSHNVQTRNLNIEPDGININSLKSTLDNLHKTRRLHRVKFLYSISYFQNPTSYTNSSDKKEEILRILRFYEQKAAHPIYYVEDAAYRELRFGGEDVRSALSFKGLNRNAIYAGTFSKPYATGIRVGFAFLPYELFTVIKRIKGNHDFGTANFLQQTIAEAIKSGEYDKHLKILSARYSRKAGLMEKAIRKHFNFPVSFKTPQGGLYFWVELPEGVKTDFKSRVFQNALKNNVLYVPGNICYACDRTFKTPHNQLRLSFGYATEYEIVEGIKRLGAAVKTAIKT
ncbi:MAG: PLP-dependent aminotransferase family protein [Verrucomicrobiia bacterium]